jgi:hypothetical protein
VIIHVIITIITVIILIFEPRNAASPTIFLLSRCDGRRQHRRRADVINRTFYDSLMSQISRHLRHPQNLRSNLKDCGRYWSPLQQHSRHRLIHLRHEWRQQRPCSHAQVHRCHHLSPCFFAFNVVQLCSFRVFNSTARYVDQGGGKRPGASLTDRCKSLQIYYSIYKSLLTLGPGAFAIYLEPWHADVEVPLSPIRSSRAQLSSSCVLTSNQVFLELRKNHGSEEHRARDLFYALWIPDIFMRRVEAEAQWSLFCPTEAPGLYSILFMQLKRYAHFAP